MRGSGVISGAARMPPSMSDHADYLSGNHQIFRAASSIQTTNCGPRLSTWMPNRPNLDIQAEFV
jgi:hypothetical protein